MAMTPREAGEAAFYECEGNNAACLKAAFDAYEAANNHAKALEARQFCDSEASLWDGGPGCFVQCDLCKATSDDGAGAGEKAVTVCVTCNGHGMIGALMPWGDSQVDSVCEPCPDCSVPAPAGEPRKAVGAVETLIESLQEGLMTDAGLDEDERVAMRHQIVALETAVEAIRSALAKEG